MARPGVTVGDWLKHISDVGPVKGLRIRIELAVQENPFKDSYLECLKAAEEGSKQLIKEGKFQKCQEMIDDFEEHRVVLEFFDDFMIFSWE